MVIVFLEINNICNKYALAILFSFSEKAKMDVLSLTPPFPISLPTLLLY